MGRSRFLKLLEDFHNNYCMGLDKSNDVYKIIQEKAEAGGKTIYEYLSCKQGTPISCFSQIDYEKIKRITTIRKNPFETFYNFEEAALRRFFEALHKTGLFLKYFEKFKMDELRTYKERQVLLKKYNAVKEDLYKVGADNDVISFIENRMIELKKTPTLTERRIFEDFFVSVVLVLPKRDGGYGATRRAAEITKLITKEYFDKDIHISKSTRIENFKTYYYTMETQEKIPLTHSRAQ